MAPPGSGLPIKDREAKNILANHAIMNDSNGVHIVRPGKSDVETVVISGRVKGTVSMIAFGMSDFLQEHQTRLESAGIGKVYVPEEALHLYSRTDISVFDVM